MADCVSGGRCAGVPLAFSEERRGDTQQTPGMGMHGHQGKGMHGMDMMGGMMQGCPMMNRGGSAAGGLVPQLPPGNEKLQVQMTAEIMQKAGEIAAKYAAQAK